MSIIDGSNQAYLADQYRNPSNLNARVRLHHLYSTNPYGWQRWVFDQLRLPDAAQVLELGCGPGDLWFQNHDRIPAGWQITLSDFSAGMLAQVQARLDGLRVFNLEQVDAGAPPFPFQDGQFHAVIANHMLYHVTDRKAALAEIRRVLKPGGTLFCSTVGQDHLKEINALVSRFDPALTAWGSTTDVFTLENGADQLAPWFPQITIHRYEDALEVTDAAPLVDYILSGWIQLPPERLEPFRVFVAAEIEASGGAFHITKDSGLFKAGTRGNP